jgi:hypothetical protein
MDASTLHDLRSWQSVVKYTKKQTSGHGEQQSYVEIMPFSSLYGMHYYSQV